jgi:GntR family transcriptional regulator / MocR family aminotransferase
MMARQTNSPGGFPPDLLLQLPSGGGRGVRERLEHALRVAIQQERLRGGVVLPPSRVLATDLGVARTVVVEAYRNLAVDGYLETRRGGWTRVRPHSQGKPPRDEPPRGYEDQLFFGWRQAASRAQIRLLGGLPDPSLFPRREWLHQYRAALAELPQPALGYPDILGAEPLRQALADYLGRARGAVAAPERIIVCGGFTQGLTLVCRALGRAGARRVAVEEPCHIWHRAAIEAAGLEPVPVSADDRGLDPAALPDNVDAVVTAPAHSYPSGSTLDGARRRTLVAWAARTGTLVIEDDYDAELRYDRAPIGTLQGLAPDQVVYIGSASKTLTPGLRLGWLIAPSRLVEQFAREKHHDDMGSSLLEQHALARFVESGSFARHLRRIRPIYRDRRDAAIRALETFLPSARWRGEAAGLHLLLTFPATVDAKAVTAAAYEQNVLVELGAWHWAISDQAPPSLVLGYGGASEARIRRGIRVIAEALEEQRSRHRSPPIGLSRRKPIGR